MAIVSNKSLLELYPDGSKCAEYRTDLSKTASMTWEAIYWRAKYLYAYGRDKYTNRELIDYFNECFNQGLSVNANQEMYMDARKILSSLYILEEDFKMASNCIQAVLDITEDIPAEMFLDLTYAELHTDLLRIIKSPSMFFSDLHMADSDRSLRERQKNIMVTLLLSAAKAKSKNRDISIDVQAIAKEVVYFGLIDSKEYEVYKKVLGGDTLPIVIPEPPKPEPPKPQPQPKAEDIEKPKKKKTEDQDAPKRDSNGLLIIELFPEKEEKSEPAAPAKVEPKKVEPKKEPPKKVEPKKVEPVAEVEVIKTEPKAIDESAPKAEAIEPQPKASSTLQRVEDMFAGLMAAVKANADQIASLNEKVQVLSDDSETEKIKAALQEGEARNQELMEQLANANAQIVENEKELDQRAQLLEKSEKQIAENQRQIAENEKRIAEKEKEKSDLEAKIASQNALLEERKNAEFTEDELKAFEPFEKVIIFDTCSIEHCPDLLEYITDKEMVRISQTVVQELENHKKNRFDTEKSKIGQRCLKAIRSRKASLAYDYEDCYTFLLPEALRIKEDDDDIGTANDKEIFSVALRYKRYTNIPVLLISDDTTVQVMAESEHIENMSAAEFISNRTKFVAEVPPVVEPQKLTKEEFLARKLKCNEYTISQHEVLLMQSCGIKTIGDLLSKTEDELSFIKDKKGISYKARLIQIVGKIKSHYSRLFDQ